MRKILICAVLSILVGRAIHAQDTIPHVQGKVSISIKKGTIACDLVISNMPRLSNYYLRLNSGMNIRYLQNAEEGSLPLNYERSPKDSLSSGESIAYFIPAYNASGKYLPRSIRVSYVGMYPVIADTTAAVDWRGNIAFNGSTLRADGIQSAWCPILYDVHADRMYEKVTYDLEITCPDCQVIYLNGNKPVSGTRARLKSSSVQDLTLFAGAIRSVAVKDNFYLNPDASDAQLNELDSVLRTYQGEFANHLRIPYKGSSVYIQTTPVSKRNSWLFASYPTIVKVGWEEGMRSFFNQADHDEFAYYMAHELAHYYFGHLRAFNSELGDFISEGFSEYLALYIARTKMSASAYRQRLEAKVRALRNFKPVPVAAIRKAADYGDRELYSYYYAPLLLSAIEKEIGEEKMWAWMRALLTEETRFTNEVFFEQTLQKVLNDEAKFRSLRERYLASEASLAHAIDKLGFTPKADPVATKDTTKRTYYYFFFSRPLVDAGSTQNQVIKHSLVGQVTCTPDELSRMAVSVFQRFKEACENDGGCNCDFNTYDSREQADAALQRWLDRHNKSGRMQVKKLAF